MFSQPVPTETVLLYENFSHYRAGDAAGWGPDTMIMAGLDRRKWLASNADGPHTVGRRIMLPSRFYFQCRYSAYMPEITRGAAGWWKEPVSTRLVFLNRQGAKYSIQWVITYGNEPTVLNPLGTPLLSAKKYFHNITLPDGSTSEIGIVQPTGVLRIDWNSNVVNVLMDGQVAAIGTVRPMGELVGFEIDVVRAKNGSLFFTDFKIAR